MTSCIYADYGDVAEVFESKLVRGRKDHLCTECGDTINKGDLHEVARGLWEECWERFRTCARCLNIRHDYFYGFCYTALVEDFVAKHGFDYRDGIPEDFAPCKEVA